KVTGGVSLIGFLLFGVLDVGSAELIYAGRCSRMLVLPERIEISTSPLPRAQERGERSIPLTFQRVRERGRWPVPAWCRWRPGVAGSGAALCRRGDRQRGGLAGEDPQPARRRAALAATSRRRPSRWRRRPGSSRRSSSCATPTG